VARILKGIQRGELACGEVLADFQIKFETAGLDRTRPGQLIDERALSRSSSKVVSHCHFMMSAKKTSI
jgi:hypothetical protein